jgi:hypothetical protein
MLLLSERTALVMLHKRTNLRSPPPPTHTHTCTHTKESRPRNSASAFGDVWPPVNAIGACCAGLVETSTQITLVSLSSGHRVDLHRDPRCLPRGAAAATTTTTTTSAVASSPTCFVDTRHFASDEEYALEISVGWAINASGIATVSSSGGTATARVRLHTALRTTDWALAGAEWIGGGTALRGRFALPATRGAITTATAYVSGVGCVELTVNGVKPDNTSFMNPGWANLPTVRNLYSAHDVTSVLVGVNVIGLRLGMCKYGYQGAFCAGAGGATATCRGAIVVLSVHFADGGPPLNVTTTTSNATGATSKVRSRVPCVEVSPAAFVFSLLLSSFPTFVVERHINLSLIDIVPDPMLRASSPLRVLRGEKMNFLSPLFLFLVVERHNAMSLIDIVPIRARPQKMEFFPPLFSYS